MLWSGAPRKFCCSPRCCSHSGVHPADGPLNAADFTPEPKPTPKVQGDAGMGTIRRHLEYKCNWRYTDLVVAHRFFPSSKICSTCQTFNAKMKWFSSGLNVHTP